MQDTVPFGGQDWFILLGLLLFSRGMDFLSTWIATPRLLLEGNPIARKLGWKWGGVVNVVMCVVFAAWLLPAIVICTTSLLVAARNFQSAWLMRTLGEENFRAWFVARVRETSAPMYLLCLFGQTFLTLLVGAALILFSMPNSVPFVIGVGVAGYALAVAFYTLLGFWHTRRAGI